MSPGTLPTSWGALNTAKGIDLSGNKLSGTVPDTWGNMLSLQVPPGARLRGRRLVPEGPGWAAL